MNQVFALLGKRDEPTDALEEYCHYLGLALQSYRVELHTQRVPWEKLGWSEALQQLRSSAAAWNGQWVLVQYTALAWSSRGFPSKFLRVLKTLRSSGARVAIVFHDVRPSDSPRLIDHVRRVAQVRVMRRALALVDLAIFPVELSKLSWLPGVPSNAVFIPVGANLPVPSQFNEPPTSQQVPTVGVFSITGGQKGTHETREILAAIRHASERIGKLRLLVFGRHAELRQTALAEGLQGLPVELSVEGVASAQVVVESLRQCDLLLFVRGVISSRRGSAIAGIACGLPVIAYQGEETAPPITEAGVVLIPEGNASELGPALVRVLTDDSYRSSLACQSRTAYLQHFSWTQIARNYLKALGLPT